MLLRLYICGYLNRVQSSRRLEREAGRECRSHVAAASARTDPKTIADFRNPHRSNSFELLGEVKFEIIGFDMPEAVLPPNVIYLGSKPHEEIIAIAKRWTVGLIPFKHSRLSRSVDPIKVYEYLSLGLTVVSSPMGKLQQFPCTFCYEEFGLLDALFRALAYKRSAEDVRRVAEILEKASWKQRLISLLDLSGIVISADSVCVAPAHENV